MIKILIIVVSLENSNGTERAVVNFANSFDLEKYEITILSLLKQNDCPIFSLKKGVLLDSLGFDEYASTMLFKCARNLRGYLKANDFNYIISTLVYISITLPFITRKKVIAWEHVSFYYHSKILREIRGRIYRKLHLVVCQTKFDLDKYSKKLDNVICIPNIVKININVKRSENIKRVLIVTRFSPEKGIDQLYQIIRGIYSYDRCVDFSFTVVGDGLMKDDFRRKSHDMIDSNFLTLIDKTMEVEKYYVNSDILILPSLSESFGLVIVEAFLYRLPVIAFGIQGGPSALIDNGINGYLIRPFNVSDFIEQIISLMADPNLRKVMGFNNELKGGQFSDSKINSIWVKYLIDLD